MLCTDRFLQYVQYDTEPDENSSSGPSSEGQRIFGEMIMEEMAELGIKELRRDSGGNIIGRLPSNLKSASPALVLLAHMDTSPEASGRNVRAKRFIYTGGDVELSEGVTLSPTMFPELEQEIGHEIITSDGTTLLGADDKAGIAEILTAVEIINRDGLPHGDLVIVFTADEEILRGTEGLDIETLGCDFGYSIDGGPVGEIEYECFNASSAVVTIHGSGLLPSVGSSSLMSASALSMRFNGLIPADCVQEDENGYGGFIRLHRIEGDSNMAVLTYLLRDHSLQVLEEKKKIMLDAAEKLSKYAGRSNVSIEIKDHYRNMRDMILPHMHLIQRAEDSFRKWGIEPFCAPIRGGTDGAVLSHHGIPCPNISAGGRNIHSVFEYIPVASLEILPLVICELVSSFTLPFHIQ